MTGQKLSKNCYEREISVNELPKSDLLQYAIDNGMIDLDTIQKQIEMNERKKYLEMHNYKVWQGQNGYWYTKVDEVGGKKLKKRKTKKEIEDLIVSLYKDKKIEPTVNDVFKMWVDEKLELKEICKNTYDRYCNVHKKYMNDTTFGNSKIRYVQEIDIEYFIRTTIAEHGLTSKAYAGLRTNLLGTFRYAKKHGNTKISISNFFGDIQLSKTVFKKNLKDKREKVYTEEESIVITDYLKKSTLIEYLGILLVFQTGIRVGELAALKPEDINGRGLNIRRTEIAYKDENLGKQVYEVRDFPKSEAGFRTIIMSKEAIHTIQMINFLRDKNDEYLFSKHGERIKSRCFGWHLKNVCKELNIPFRSMHKIRATYGTTLIDNNVDDSFVVEQMGHSDIKCTRQYYYFSNKSMAQKIAQIDSAINW